MSNLENNMPNEELENAAVDENLQAEEQPQQIIEEAVVEESSEEAVEAAAPPKAVKIKESRIPYEKKKSQRK